MGLYEVPLSASLLGFGIGTMLANFHVSRYLIILDSIIIPYMSRYLIILDSIIIPHIF